MNTGGVIYKDKKEALKANVCYLCQTKMNGAYVVATMHGKSDLHIPLCSKQCLEEYGEILAEVLIEKNR